MSFLNAAISATAGEQSYIPSRSDLAAMSADHCKKITVAATIAFVEAMNHGFSVVWNNQSGLSPQEVLDALGSDASSIFNDHAATVAYLADRAPSIVAMVQLPPVDATITHNADGTVTVAFPAEEPLT